jgi:hypothetical protein
MGNPPTNFPTGIQVAEIYNYWPGRVWFHRNADRSGWADCINPLTFYLVDSNSRDFNAGNIQSVDNGSPC